MDTIKGMCPDKVRNFFNMEDNLSLVESELNKLSCRASDMKREVTKAEKTGRRKRKREVENWFEEVEQMENKFNELICRIRDEPWWKNLSSGDCMVKIGADVDKLMVQSRDFEERLWLDDHENRGEPLLVPKDLFGQIFQRDWKKIWDWLIKDDLFNIGIYGMGGVGKTTLAKCIHNHLLKKTDFKVFWVTVSQNFSVKKLQDDIAKQVPLDDLSGEDNENRRAAMLSRAIANHSLLILDDVWEDFSLEDVGIPVGPKCRLILTTRSLELCNTMGCQGKFEVKCLEADEAWNLFKKTLDHGIILSVEVEKIAKLVAKECAGLPLGIITVARSMKGAIEVPEWRSALDQLTTLSIGHTKMGDKVFRILEFSFIHLNIYERLCFLYCCLYPEDWEVEIEELITLYSLAELIPGRERKLEFDHGHTIINKLIRVCLLEESITRNGKKCVKMHDLIRDMALRITSGKYISKITEHVPVFLVKEISRNESNNLLLKNEEWKDDLDAVSLIAGPFYRLEIPRLMSPNCWSLSTLIINRAIIREIPDSFLHHMYGLKVLNLEGCALLQSLPNCISDMVNLTALLLEGCSGLESVPPIGKLKKLRILNLFGTEVVDVPQGLEELVNLERLYMALESGSRGARVLPEGTFSKLYHLQHLVFPATVHISHLRALNELQLYMGGLTYEQFANSGWWPTHYKIHIIPLDAIESSEISYLPFHDFDNSDADRNIRSKNQLRFEYCKFQEGLDVVLPPENLHELYLLRCSGLSDGFFHRWIDRSKELYHLSLRHSEELEFVLNLSSADDDEGVASNLEGALRNLRVIDLRDLPNLVGLVNIGRVSLIPAGTFSSLEELVVDDCDRLKKLFSVQLVQQCLQNLKRLTVESCRQVEEIVEGGGEAIIFHQSSSGPIASTTQKLLLPKLQELSLDRLPKLESVCSPTIMIGGEEPTTFRVDYCPKLKRLPSFSSVKITYNIGGSKEWWNSLEWKNPRDKDAVQPFFEASVVLAPAPSGMRLLAPPPSANPRRSDRLKQKTDRLKQKT